jgi:hypothetical protein
MVMIPAADIEAGVQMEYTMEGSGHTHPLTVTMADFQTLQQTGQVMITSGNADDGHSHPVTLTCA